VTASASTGKTRETSLLRAAAIRPRGALIRTTLSGPEYIKIATVVEYPAPGWAGVFRAVTGCSRRENGDSCLWPVADKPFVSSRHRFLGRDAPVVSPSWGIGILSPSLFPVSWHSPVLTLLCRRTHAPGETSFDLLKKLLEVGEGHSRIVVVIGEAGLVFQFLRIHFAYCRACLLHHTA